MRRNLKHTVIFTVIGLFLLQRSLMLGGIFLIIALVQLASWHRHPWRSIDRTIAADARRHGCALSRTADVQQAIHRLYQRHASTSKANPHLMPDYEQILDSMWHKLAVEQSPRTQLETIRKVMKNWPDPARDNDIELEQSLNKAQRNARRWQQARREAEFSMN